jgi:hypothetical protein
VIGAITHEGDPALEALVRWDELRAQGKDLAVEELCPDDSSLWDAVALEPSLTNRNTLGTVLYHAGQVAEAIAELEKNVAADSPLAGYDHLILAMCQQRLGQTESARWLVRSSGERRPGLPIHWQPGSFRHFLRKRNQLLADGFLTSLPASSLPDRRRGGLLGRRSGFVPICIPTRRDRAIGARSRT